MAKFNEKNTIKTTNRSGHVAYKLGMKEDLMSKVLTTFYNESKFYGDTSNEIVEIATELAKTDPKFVSNLARYARKEMHLRSVAHVLTCVVANVVETKPYIGQTVYDVVERADDLTEILACYINMYGKPIPNGLKKALAKNIKRFDEYSLAKYDKDSSKFKFRDILRITHAKPENEEQNELFNKVLNDGLETPITWETVLSDANDKRSKKEKWESLIEEDKLGYMAILRNLRNMLNEDIGYASMSKITETLSNRGRVLKSKQLPFRFFSAYNEIKNNSHCTSKLLDALETAIEHSVMNTPKLKGRTLIAIDASGSMTGRTSDKSNVSCHDIACLLGVLASRICDDSITIDFASDYWGGRNGRIKDCKKYDISTKSGILSQMSKFLPANGGTPMSAPFNYLMNNNIEVDRIIILSDNDTNSESKAIQSYLNKYREKFGNPNVWVHGIDLQGYGTTQFNGRNTSFITGWNEKVLEFINLIEEGVSSQVKKIENYD